MKKILFAAGAVVLASWGIGQAAAPAPFTLTSTTFKDGTMMPAKVANMNQPGAQANPNCVGQNVSPELSWSGAPAGTKSFALTMVDPDVTQIPGGFVHGWPTTSRPRRVPSVPRSAINTAWGRWGPA